MNLDDTNIAYLLTAIFFLGVLSAYFSGSETALMALNRYRLKNLSRSLKAARITEKLLIRPDRLFAVILIGNNLVNFIAVSLATLAGFRLWGDLGGTVIAPIVMTILVLIFAEITPKTVAAHFPEKFAFFSVYILRVLLKVLFPLVVSVNFLSNKLSKLFGVRSTHLREQSLNKDELRIIMHKNTNFAAKDQDMLLRVMDLNTTTAKDVMVPRSDVFGIDIEKNMTDIRKTICSSPYTRIPVYKDSLDNVVGILHTRKSNRFFTMEQQTKKALLGITDSIYFIHELTSLTSLLVQFQQRKKRMGLIVDEYGDIIGIVTLDDILEEIVGNLTAGGEEISTEKDGSKLILGSTQIRDINRTLNWDLPTDGANTLSGLIIERLESIPHNNVCISMGLYQMETTRLLENRIHTVRIIKINQPVGST